jgi:predicted component of type VI protein secretion system
VFEALFARVLSLLSVDLQPAYRDVELEHRSDGVYLGKLHVAAKHELFVAVKAGMAEALLRERAPKVLKIADWSQIYDVVKQARHGVRSEVEWNPSAVLPIQPGICFFRIRKEGPFWKTIEKSSTVALYLPSEGEWSGASIALYAVDPIHLT